MGNYLHLQAMEKDRHLKFCYRFFSPKGNQCWIFIGRTDTETETPILCSCDMKSQLIRKNPDAGKGWGQEEKGATEDEVVGWHRWLNVHELEQTLGDGKGQGSLACWVTESDTTWATGQQQQQQQTLDPLFLLIYLLYIYIHIIYCIICILKLKLDILKRLETKY